MSNIIAFRSIRCDLMKAEKSPAARAWRCWDFITAIRIIRPGPANTIASMRGRITVM